MKWLLIHGVPTGPAFWSRLQLPGEVIAPECPGAGSLDPFGRLRKPDARCPSAVERRFAMDRGPEPPPPTLADLVAPLRAHAGPDVTVVGVDFGGILAAMLAAEGLAGRLVLMSTALGAAWLPSRIASYEPFVGPFYRRSAGQRFLRTADPSGDLARAFPPDDTLPARMIALARLLDVRPLHATRRALIARRVPTLCLWGDADPFFPPLLGRRLAQQLGAEWRTIPSVGGRPARHAVAWTQAGEVGEILRGWGG